MKVACMLGSKLRDLIPFWIDFGSPNESITEYVCIFVLEIWLRNLADCSRDSVLHPRPSDSLKLSSRLHEKHVFVKSQRKTLSKSRTEYGIYC